MTVFWIIAAALVAASFLFVLPPLFQRKESEEKELDREALNVAIFQDQIRELESDLQNGTLSEEQFNLAKDDMERELLEGAAGQAQKKEESELAHSIISKASAWFIVFALPVSAIIVYNTLGGGADAMNPEQVQQQQAEMEGHDGSNVEQMIASLEARMAETPEDPEGWAMLARSYYFIQEYHAAADAYAKAITFNQAPPADLYADAADALALAQNRDLRGEPMALIKKALEVNPDHAKSLWLAGTGAYQQEDFASAKQYWQRLFAILPPGSENAQMIQANLAEVSQLLGEEAPAPASQAVQASISGSVVLAPEIAAKAAPDDVVFVYAQAPSGPRMPLAIVRKQVKDLPFNFTLDDSTAMTPAMKLSAFSEVIVGARVSKSGNAMRQPGDIEGTAGKLNVSNTGTVSIVIDTLVN